MTHHAMLEKIDNIKEKITDGEYKDLVEGLAKLKLAKPDIDVDAVKYVRVKMHKIDIRCCSDCDSEVLRVENVKNIFRVADDAPGRLNGNSLCDYEDPILRTELKNLIYLMERKWTWCAQHNLQYLIYDIEVIE
jgi:queuine/archaeosine tRNA-ribosyltransferase